jgi:hypothetical protein
MKNITQELLKELLHYHPDTGVFTWKERDKKTFGTGNFNSLFAGKVAGHMDPYGYLVIRIFEKAFKAHRLAILYVTGSMPSNETDHIDGNGANNEYKNLRCVTSEINAKNRKIRSDNKSGVQGVSWRESSNKWVARININKKRVHIGNFDSLEEAVKARNKLMLENGYHDNHGRIK